MVDVQCMRKDEAFFMRSSGVGHQSIDHLQNILALQTSLSTHGGRFAEIC